MVEHQEPESFFQQIFSQLPKFMLIYFAMNFISQSLLQPQQQRQADASTASTSPQAAGKVQQASSSSLNSAWKVGEETGVFLYLDANAIWTPETSKLVMHEDGLRFGDFYDERMKTLSVECTEQMQNNGSLYAHIFLTKDGLRPFEAGSSKAVDKIRYVRKLLTRYQPRKKMYKKKNLVSKKEEKEQVEPEVIDAEERPIVSYWWNNLTIHHVGMDSPLPSLKQQPPQIVKFIELDRYSSGYLPIFYVNDFWMLQEDLQPINSTIDQLTLHVSYNPIAFWRFQLYTQLEESFRIQTDVMGADPQDQDSIKSMFLHTNPWLLSVTMIVSLLHSLFDFLAFKNDITFWKNKKSMEGISFRALLLGIVFQAIIFLYLVDNDTSYMILVSQAIGLVIEVWKINKTVIVKRKPVFPFLEFKDRVNPSKLAAKTQKYDRMAFSYLSYALFPILVAYTAYSLQYEQHKSWYSFIIGTLVGFVYMFGFIQLTPQLFINYKLKSVAHMPVKTFIYKALNTFIDDLFAFVIKMPWLHRLACLRDDVVFLVYLYQRWIYREDKRRRNEFGQVGEEVGEENDDLSSDEEEERVLEDKQGEIEPLVLKTAIENPDGLVKRNVKAN